ncbi:M28 family metallopeptidase [Streptomyces qinglanensis]|uniref:Zn-dependent amino-or carboxypeptidase, M28 family n=1 Tax=Streptomyces qinglanensis TaxID=943816 RepID=A0A1H9Q7N4_9ACTN|nr:M28 family metallopeptidase [Streptomyces qinglanensis]SER56491.1 Zn-dependent amino-or carboxypeptidase, M28 family [Streptomyces qinglanensis]
MSVPLRSPRSSRALRRRSVAALAATALATPLLLISSPAAAEQSAADRKPPRQSAKKGDKLARKLVRRTSGHGARKHLAALSAIAHFSDGNRGAGSAGHDRSARYAGTLLKAAGYKVTYQKFEFTFRETLAEKLTVLGPNQRDVPITLMTYTKSTPEGGVEAPVAVVPVDADGTTGCEAGDYAQGTFDGRIALIKRGGCTFAQKQAAAADAGAVGAVVYNNTDGALNGTLGSPDAARIPTGGITLADGEALAEQAADGDVTVNLEVREHQEQRTTHNVLAETRGGDPDNTVMLGAHLDSVPEGPGINDNGSGSAGILETALQLAKADHKGKHANKVRFALWSAEELGLLGAEHYVAELPAAEREKISLYLNFDMIASPNYGMFAYDGDDSDGTGAGPGPEGSAVLEKDLVDFLATRGTETRGTDFTGRSDYGPFIEAGIPSGGTFTGAEGIKTAEQQKLWGGTAGAAYDGCYHQACDNLENIDPRAFDLNVKAIANAVGHYAWDTRALPRGTDRPAAQRLAATEAADDAPSAARKPATGPYKGSRLVR